MQRLTPVARTNYASKIVIHLFEPFEPRLKLKKAIDDAENGFLQACMACALCQGAKAAERQLKAADIGQQGRKWIVVCRADAAALLAWC